MRLHELRPLVVDIAAPQVLVFEMASAVNGSLPGSPPHSAELLERTGDELIVRYRTPAYVTDLVLIERVRLYPPERIEYEEALEANGYEVQRQLGIGPRDNTQAAITSGEVDLLPEYIGSLLAFLGREAGGEGEEEFEPTGDSAQTHERLQAALEDEGLRVLDFTPAQDHNAFVVRPDTAEQYGLETMSDLAAVATELVWGLPPECDGNPLCRGALEDVYGIPWDELRIEPLAPCDAPMAIALNEGAIDVAELCSTQPDIERFGFVVLEDDQLTQPAENIAPVVRAEVLETLPADFVDLLNTVSAAMTTEELTSLGVRVAVEQESIGEVARSWLEAQGFLD